MKPSPGKQRTIVGMAVVGVAALLAGCGQQAAAPHKTAILPTKKTAVVALKTYAADQQKGVNTGISVQPVDNNGGGGNNVVRVVNRVDGRLTVKGKIKLNQVNSDNAAPGNLSYAYASCANCQTFAIALEINLIKKTASTVAPQNLSVALNYKCTGCTTVARALQYNISVDDPAQTPPNVSDLIKQMDHEMHALQSDHSITLTDAQTRIDSIIQEFNSLGQYLSDKRDNTTADTSPNATPLPTDTATSATPTGGTGTPPSVATGTSLPVAPGTATPGLPDTTATPVTAT